jgi:hypothetical protein
MPAQKDAPDKSQRKNKKKKGRLMNPLCNMGIHNNRRSQALLCWVVFAAGLLIQLLAPHLKISNGAFVIPPTLTAGANEIRPAEIVARQRRMQLISALLTVSGALGLAVLYRDILTGRTSRRASESVDGQSDLILRERQRPDATTRN